MPTTADRARITPTMLRTLADEIEDLSNGALPASLQAFVEDNGSIKFTLAVPNTKLSARHDAPWQDTLCLWFDGDSQLIHRYSYKKTSR